MADKDSMRWKKAFTPIFNRPFGIGMKTPIKHDAKLIDTRSETSDSTRISHGYHAGHVNTYKLEPDCDKMFLSGKMEKLMRDVMKSMLGEIQYDVTRCPEIAKELAIAIKMRAKELKWPRYRLIVQTVISQNRGQGLYVGSRCIWDESTDNFARATYENKSLMAVITCFGVYFE